MGIKPNSPQAAEWSVVQSTTGTSTATKTGVAGKRHLLTSVICSFTGSGNEGNLVVKDSTEVVIDVTVHDDLDWEPNAPLRFGVGNDVTVELGGAGGGAVGRVTILGYTADPVTYRAIQSST